MSDQENIVFPRNQKVQTSALGIVEIRELTIEDITTIASELMSLLQALPAGVLAPSAATDGDESSKVDGMEMAKVLLSNKQLLISVKVLLAQLTEKEAKDYDRLPVADFIKLVRAFFKVNPIGEIRELFLEITAILGTNTPENSPNKSAESVTGTQDTESNTLVN
jgi:hypothetical protein